MAPMAPSSLIIDESPGVGAGDSSGSAFSGGWVDWNLLWAGDAQFLD